MQHESPKLFSTTHIQKQWTNSQVMQINHIINSLAYYYIRTCVHGVCLHTLPNTSLFVLFRLLISHTTNTTIQTTSNTNRMTPSTAAMAAPADEVSGGAVVVRSGTWLVLFSVVQLLKSLYDELRNVTHVNGDVQQARRTHQQSVSMCLYPYLYTIYANSHCMLAECTPLHAVY